VSFPPAHFLIGAGAAELADTGRRLPRPGAWLLGGALAVIPDFDTAISRVSPRIEPHGTYSHSLFAVAVVGVVAWAVGGRHWGALAGAAYGSHLLVDLLDGTGRTNVMLGWPFTRAQPHALGALFPVVEFHRGDGVLGAARSLLEPAVLSQLALQTAVGGVFALGLVALARAVRRAGDKVTR
jgi:membrane-bound metal-dependent hydrolase YbcI (DUF457 family)